MVHFSHRHTRDCINNITNTLNDNIANFPDGLYTQTRMQLPAWYFRCLLRLETEDVEIKVKMMRDIHMFRRDRTTQVISCNPWSTRLHPYPSLIRKMKMHHELEGTAWPQTPTPIQLQLFTSTPSHDRNSLTRKTLVPQEGREETGESQSTSEEKV